MGFEKYGYVLRKNIGRYTRKVTTFGLLTPKNTFGTLVNSYLIISISSSATRLTKLFTSCRRRNSSWEWSYYEFSNDLFTVHLSLLSIRILETSVTSEPETLSIILHLVGEIFYNITNFESIIGIKFWTIVTLKSRLIQQRKVRRMLNWLKFTLS